MYQLRSKQDWGADKISEFESKNVSLDPGLQPGNAPQN